MKICLFSMRSSGGKLSDREKETEGKLERRFVKLVEGREGMWERKKEDRGREIEIEKKDSER